MTSENDLEVKVAKLETKMDTIIDTVALINRKFDELMEDRVTRRELEEFKAEVKGICSREHFSLRSSLV